MPERRKHERIAKRVRVEYGEDDLSERGLVLDISVGGLFIKCRRLIDIGTRIHLHLLEPEADFYAEGVVVRQRRVEPRYRRIEDQGIGVRFRQPAELVREIIPRKRRRRETNSVRCSSPADVQQLLSGQQLGSGLLVVPAGDPIPTASTVVEFTIEIAFGSDPTKLEGDGRILQILGAGGDDPQALIEVQDAAALRSKLEEHS